jgi:hypothetical protein
VKRLIRETEKPSFPAQCRVLAEAAVLWALLAVGAQLLLPAEKKTCFGGGRLAIPCGGQRGKRPALVNPSSPGKSGIHAALIFAAAGRWLMRVSA